MWWHWGAKQLIYHKPLPNTKTAHKIKDKLFTDNCGKCVSLPTFADDSTLLIKTRTRFEAQELILDKVSKIKTFLDSNTLPLTYQKRK